MDELRKWKEKEQERVNRICKTDRNKMTLYAIIAFVVCIAVVTGIHLASGGTAVNGIKYGAIFGAFIFLLILLCNLSYLPGGYMKCLEKELKKQLPDERDKQNFAAQMLQTDVKKLEFRDSNKRTCGFLVSKDYAFLYGFKSYDIVRLSDIKKLVLDRRENTVYINSGGVGTRSTSVTYPMSVFYTKTGEAPARKERPDKILFFPSENTLGQAAAMVQSSSETN